MPEKIFVCKIEELEPGRMKSFKLGARKAMVVNTGDEFLAYYNFCTHQGGPLKICGAKFCCQWHGAEFDIKTGVAQKAPAPAGSQLQSIPVVVEGEDLFVLWTPPVV